jgi:hypothetical protein
MKVAEKRARREGRETTAEAFLSKVKTPGPSERLREYGLQRVFARAETTERKGAKRAYGKPVLLHRTVMVVMAAMLLVLASTAGAYALSSDAQPGSALYGTKIFFERASIALTRSSAEDIKLEMEFSNRRMRELEAMVAAGDQNGAERWLREYERNITQASELLDRSGGDVEELSLQYQHMLDRHAHMMSGMCQGQPPGLEQSIEGAYNTCESQRMRHQQGRGGTPSPSQPPGDTQPQESCPQVDGSSTQEAPSYPRDMPTTEGQQPVQDAPGSQDSSTQPDPVNQDGGQMQQGQEDGREGGMHGGFPIWWP